MPRDRQLIGKSCCLVLRDQVIEVRSSMREARMEIRSANKELEAWLEWELSKLCEFEFSSKMEIYIAVRWE